MRAEPGQVALECLYTFRTSNFFLLGFNGPWVCSALGIHCWKVKWKGSEQEVEDTLNEMSLSSGPMCAKSLKNEREGRKCVTEELADTSGSVKLFSGY